MLEKTLFLLKPDALQLSLRTFRARFEFYKQLQSRNLSVLVSARFKMTYDMLIGYQPVLAPDYKTEMTKDWKDATINYQLGPDRTGRDHLLVIVEGYNALATGPQIKKYIRNKYCTPWEKYAPSNLIHTPDNNEEYESDLDSLQSVIKSATDIKSLEILYNTRREK